MAREFLSLFSSCAAAGRAFPGLRFFMPESLLISGAGCANIPSVMTLRGIASAIVLAAGLPAFGEKAYVFSYFNDVPFGGRRGEAAGLRLATSPDAKRWTVVNEGRPVLVPEVGKDRLMRDPSICRGPDGTFHLVWTLSWYSKSIGYASSRDLIHWSEQREIPVMEGIPETRNCWAPEVTYNPDDGLFYVYWSSTVTGRHSPIAGMRTK